ncbi:MAG: hypothetical protein Q7S58_19360 [Candidatus Binatus sp.]|nr:hypothetical protein [Candidatus Binatus sp.]MDO8434561.1 hypothetical protein [Candidatus Binatus sp.]
MTVERDRRIVDAVDELALDNDGRTAPDASNKASLTLAETYLLESLARLR